MPDWLPWILIVVAAAAGHMTGVARPRRRLYSTTAPDLPTGARVSTRENAPTLALLGLCLHPRGHPRRRPARTGDDECTRVGHRLLSWAETVERRRGGVTVRRIAEARCGGCGRSQTSVRPVYPPDRVLEINPPRQPRPDPGPPPDATSGSDSAHSAGQGPT